MASMGEMRRIAWYVFWRSAVAGLVLGFVLGFILGFVAGFLGYFAGFDRATTQTVSTWVGGLGGLAAAFQSLNFFFARAVGRAIGGKKLELVPG